MPTSQAYFIASIFFDAIRQKEDRMKHALKLFARD